MADIRYIDKDFIRFSYAFANGDPAQETLYFGDKVEVLEEGNANKPSRIRALELYEGTLEGTVKGKPFRDRTRGVLKFTMVDVQQGDGMVLETPPDENHQRHIVLIDGGDNQLFARHLAYRFRNIPNSAQQPLEVDLILITHGDADHFEGLTEILRSEKHPEERKRLFIHPRRVYHNGLVKGPKQFLGRSVEHEGKNVIVDLYEDPRNAPPEKQNGAFKVWCETLDSWEERGPIQMRRLAHGMDANQLFDFLAPFCKVEMLGPFTVEVKDPEDGKKKPGLPELHKPKKSAVLHMEDGTDATSQSFSSSHTINGHSIAFRLTYGNVRFNLTGDLNHESMAMMRKRIKLSKLEAEILKAPHHGSAEFDFKALKAMKPVVSLISSGDEGPLKEYIHPRATLVSALGKVSRGETGVILSTELAAFFKLKKYSHERPSIAKYYEGDMAITREELRKFYRATRRTPEDEKALPMYLGFERTNFGAIHVRTDGERVLVFTLSGKKATREAYRFTVDADHKVDFARDVSTG